jgi:hypothetical protein
MVLKRAGVEFLPGLTSPELQHIENEYEFRFPPDLRDFLMFALPISKGFINWRNRDKEEIQKRLSWPFEGICFDIEQNAFWLKEWGLKPDSLQEAFYRAHVAIEDAPKLIPIRGHRYIPDRPHERNNPIFSVYQTDIIYYGNTLPRYLENEFRYYFGTPEYNLKGEIKTIDFWSYLVELNG